jgi:hypothetical protein
MEAAGFVGIKRGSMPDGTGMFRDRIAVRRSGPEKSGCSKTAVDKMSVPGPFFPAAYMAMSAIGRRSDLAVYTSPSADIAKLERI